MKNSFIGLNTDFIGFSASTLCAIHCALLPFLVGFIPLAGLQFLQDAWVEYALILFSCVVATYSLVHGYRSHHKKFNALIIMVAGFAFILLGRLVPNEWLEIIASVSGASLIAFAHITNWKYIQDCKLKVPDCVTDDNIRND